jgi:predicted transcriptional regulator
MKLFKNIFKVTEDNLNFLLYLLKNPNFTIADVCNQFNLGYQTLFNHITEWEKQDFIVKKRQHPELGAVKYKYSLSGKAKKELEKITQKLSVLF